MGAEHHINIKKLFLIYVLSAIGITTLLSLYIEAQLGRHLYAMLQQHDSTYEWNIRLLLSLFILTPPAIFIAILLATAFLFGRRLANWYGPPLRELRVALEKLQQQDLNFTITYDGPDELGDLCRTVDRLRSQLQSALLREWAKEEEAREMIALLSHDLRTPVTILQGHIENLADTRPEKRLVRLEQYLPALEGNIQRLKRLLSDMMMAVSLEQSGFTLQPRSVNLEDELGRKATAYALRSAEHNISFHCQSYRLPELDGEVMLDMHRIEQILDNLFENALRFTPSGGCITLTWVWNRNALSFSMSDTGPGIAGEDLPSIFEKFYSTARNQKKSGNQAKKSTGLGLYVCKALVERHGGGIAAHNLPGGGCEVSFWVVPM